MGASRKECNRAVATANSTTSKGNRLSTAAATRRTAKGNRLTRHNRVTTS